MLITVGMLHDFSEQEANDELVRYFLHLFDNKSCAFYCVPRLCFIREGCGVLQRDLQHVRPAPHFIVLDVTGNASQKPHPQLMRWKAKRRLVLNIFQDRSARRPDDSLKRNMAVFNAMVNVGYTFEFSLDFQREDGDIGVVFVGEAKKKDIARDASFALDSAERCPAYLEFADGEGGIWLISKARVLVSDQLPLDDITECVRTGLFNAIGLIGLRKGRAMTETKEGMDQIEFFISTLYETNNINSLADIEAAVVKGKKNLCQ